MINARAGFDRNKGKFFAFTLAEAKQMVEFLIRNSYVTFEHTPYKQIRGIPMGINPAVFFATLYLGCYELLYVEQFIPVIGHSPIPEVPDANHITFGMLACATPHQLRLRDPSPDQRYVRIAASQLLDHFRFYARYADDTTVGPNPYFEHLLYTNQYVLGGKIHGIYPAQFLTLEKQTGTPTNCPALDLRILTEERPKNNQYPGTAYSFTVLFDKRRKSCFDDIPIVRYTHVTSCLTVKQSYNILRGRLMHLHRINTVQLPYLRDIARTVHYMMLSGYSLHTCLLQVKQFLTHYPDACGDSSWEHVFTLVRRWYDFLAQFPEHIRGDKDIYVTNTYTTVPRMNFVLCHDDNDSDMELG